MDVACHFRTSATLDASIDHRHHRLRSRMSQRTDDRARCTSCAEVFEDYDDELVHVRDDLRPMCNLTFHMVSHRGPANDPKSWALCGPLARPSDEDE